MNPTHLEADTLLLRRETRRRETRRCLTQVEDNQISITDPADAGGGGKREPKAFSYDFAYDWTSTQEGVHLDLGAPIVEKALQGYNGKSNVFHDEILCLKSLTTKNDS